MKKHNACIARSGIQYYLSSELPNLRLSEIPREYKDQKVFAVYRPSFVLEEAKERFIGKPIRVEHQWVYSEDDKDIIGHIGDTVKIKHIKGEVALYAPLEIESDDKLPSFKELSPGYEAVTKWQGGTAPNGEEYQIICTEITDVNHLAVVQEARGGKDMKILDGGKKMSIHSGLIYVIKKRMQGINDGTNANSFDGIIDSLIGNIENVSEEELSEAVEKLYNYCKDLPDSEEKEKLVRYIADIPLLKGEDEKVVKEALSCIKESYNSLDSDAVSENMEKTDMETKEQVPTAEEENKTDAVPAEALKADAAPAEGSPAPAPAEKPAEEPKAEEKKTDGDVMAKLADALDAISKKLDAVLGAKDETPKEEPKQNDGCTDNAPKEEPAVQDSLPKYTQSLETVQKGYSLDDAFNKLYGGR